ncbi:trigger factor [Desulfurispira natronophila]|uniref:Trigger factor n=1 Tax=Desulfurispira natronophila TaxID=682562 RepID=A0A7W7Y5N8_9BACT|nr:trigger factor [Desulfurispira natronophila]MBB5022555.1 trigger factor [Desulfurispira natronophila]
MKVELKDLENSSKEVTVTIAGSVMDAAFDKEIKKIAQKAKIKGFRPGKAPMAVVKQEYGGMAMNNASEKIMQDAVTGSIKSEEINIVSRPEITNLQRNDSNDLVVTYQVEVFPEVTPKTYQGFELERENYMVTDKDVEEAVGRILEQRAELQAVEREARDGDTLIFDFKGRVDGEYFEGGSAERFKLAIGSGQFIPGFEPQLVGLKAGDEKEIEVNFPDDYHADNLKGKPAVFEVKVHEVSENTTPPLTDELAKEISKDEEVADADEFRQRIRRDIEEYMEQQSKGKLREQIAEKLIEANDFDVPKAMIEDQARRITSNLLMQYMQNISDEKQFQEHLDALSPNYAEMAEKQVRTSLLLHAIAKALNIEANEEDVEAAIAREAKNAGTSVEDLKKRINDQARDGIEASVIEDKVIDHIIANSQVAEKTVTKEDMERQREETESEQGA